MSRAGPRLGSLRDRAQQMLRRSERVESQLSAFEQRLDELANAASAQASAIAAHGEALAAQTVLTEELLERYARSAATADERYAHVVEILRAVQEDESGNRRRLSELRATEEYELAFSEQEPLVSVLIPTYNRYAMLRDRAIPSVLAQTYERIELIVVGDQAPPETARVLSEFNNEQIRYVNLPQRGPYPEDDQRAWLVKGVPPINGALSLARGRWIAPFSDDDALVRTRLRRWSRAAGMSASRSHTAGCRRGADWMTL